MIPNVDVVVSVTVMHIPLFVLYVFMQRVCDCMRVKAMLV